MIKTRLRVLCAGFGSAQADIYLSESVRIPAERFNSVGGLQPAELKTVVSCRRDMEAYPEECEADGRRKKCYRLSKSAPSEMDKITTNRAILPAVRKCKKAGCQGYGIHMILTEIRR